ncbi:MAG: GHMP kinase, partial [Acidimicrobiia bacterium]|nr:GHMP kinase [Acidimicrobiia bacterium]
MSPARAFTATAPVRVADVGGWTDTWFARHGTVFSIAVEPLVTVRATSGGRDGGSEVVVHAPDVEAAPYGFDLHALPGRQPLLEAAIASALPPGAAGIDVEVKAGVPPGCATGTSGAVVVALLAALDALGGQRPAARALARRAHQVETEGLGLQSGVQDQLAAAHGGIYRFDVRYPEAFAHAVRVPPAALADLDRRLVLVYLGHPHRSSAVHEEVIAGLAARAAATEHPALDRLRQAALAATRAAADGDLAALGRTWVDATEA